MRPLGAHDVARAAEIEAASYPADEAASEAQLAFRVAHAPAFCSGLYSTDGGGLSGFVVGTCAQRDGGRWEHASMSTHDASGDGPLTLTIHSVVVDAPFRRRGLARAMLRDYLGAIARTSAGPAARVTRVLLISKARNLDLYVACGFGLLGRCPVAHGASEPWFEMALTLAESVYAPTPVCVPRETAASASGADGAEGEEMVQVDAFSPRCFGGNPAAVVFTQRGGDAAWMRNVAAENNLAETAFVRPAAVAVDGAADGAADSAAGRAPCTEWAIRWFTPTVEVDLCGHATIAAAHALWESGRAPVGAPIKFQTLNAGFLETSRLSDGFIRLELGGATLRPLEAALREPARQHLALAPLERELARALGLREEWIESFKSEAAAAGPAVGPAAFADLLVALSAREWAELEAASQPSGTPDLAAIAAVMRSLRLRGLVVTVAGDGCAAAVTAGGVTEQPQRSRLHASLSADVRTQLAFTSRFFAPHCGIDEDPVTGSAHALLARFWAAAAPAGATMLGYQASARGGLVRVRACEGPGDVVQVEGEATTVIRARLLA